MPLKTTNKSLQDDFKERKTNVKWIMMKNYENKNRKKGKFKV